MSTSLKAPGGKTRVIGVDLFDPGDYLVGDYDTQQEAFDTADERNKKRAGSMDDVFYVYDETGRLLRDENAVDGPGISP